jgi:hypothetical protein
MPFSREHPGKGRPAGAKNKATVERELRARAGIQAALNGDLLPLDVLLAAMRGEVLPTGRAPTDQQIQCAIAAAPYIHPRLAQADLTVRSDNVHRIISEEPLTIEQWCERNGVTAADNDPSAPRTIEGSASAAAD